MCVPSEDRVALKTGRHVSFEDAASVPGGGRAHALQGLS